MFKMDELQKMLIEAKYDFISEFDVVEGTVFLAYLDNDEVEPTIYYFRRVNDYAQPYHSHICTSYADAKLQLYSQYLCLINQETTYRAHISIPSMGMVE